MSGDNFNNRFHNPLLKETGASVRVLSATEVEYFSETIGGVLRIGMRRPDGTQIILGPGVDLVIIGTTSAQFATMKEAIDAGYPRALAIDNVSEISSSTLTSDFELNIVAGVVVTLNEFYLNIGANDVTFNYNGPGEFNFNNTVDTTPMFNTGAFTGFKFVANNFVHRNISTQAAHTSNSANVAMQLNKGRLYCNNFISSFIDNLNNESSMFDVEIVGGGASCARALDNCDGVYTNLLVTGAWVPGGVFFNFAENAQLHGCVENASNQSSVEVPNIFSGISSATTGSGIGIACTYNNTRGSFGVIGDAAGLSTSGVSNCKLYGGRLKNIFPGFTDSNNKYIGMHVVNPNTLTHNGTRHQFIDCTFDLGITCDGDDMLYAGSDWTVGTLTLAATADGTRVNGCHMQSSIVNNGDANAVLSGNTPDGVVAYAESDGVSSTSSTAFIQKLRLTTPTLGLGDYIVKISGELRNTGAGDSEVRLEQNDTTELMFSTVVSVTAWEGFSGFKVLSAISGIHTFDIDFRATNGAGVADIRRARIAFERIN